MLSFPTNTFSWFLSFPEVLNRIQSSTSAAHYQMRARCQPSPLLILLTLLLMGFINLHSRLLNNFPSFQGDEMNYVLMHEGQTDMTGRQICYRLYIQGVQNTDRKKIPRLKC